MNHSRRLATALIMALVGVIAPASTASAATKTVSITVGDWNCIEGGQYRGGVSRVLLDAIPSTSPAAIWVSGNTRYGVTVIYDPAGSRVAINGTIFCKTSWWGGGYYRYISTGRWVTSSTGTSWTI